MQTFADIFGTAPVVAAEAPGRVNLIGEHTDYNGGFVLPTVIPQRTRVELLPRPDANVRVWSANVDEAHRLQQFVLGREAPTRTWLGSVQGVAVALRQRGLHLRGVDMRVESTVPIGSGLSSSAALEVSVARALRAAFDLRLDDVELAMAGKWAENEFVGAPTGIMDQMVVSLGSASAHVEKVLMLLLLTWVYESLHAFFFSLVHESDVYATVSDIGFVISAALYCALAYMFSRRLDFITSIEGRYYERVLERDASSVTRWVDQFDLYVMKKFLGRRAPLRRLFTLKKNRYA